QIDTCLSISNWSDQDDRLRITIVAPAAVDSSAQLTEGADALADNSGVAILGDRMFAAQSDIARIAILCVVFTLDHWEHSGFPPDRAAIEAFKSRREGYKKQKE
ncbi:hypothetical protein PENTCL1PPCAC_12361, partial [Pristionchus entomophagus]